MIYLSEILLTHLATGLCRLCCNCGFLAVARPQIAVISVGAENTFGHPSPQVLERLSGRTVYRTDESGTIEFTTDGERLWVKTEKGR